jgi:hypothetical protein
MKRRIRKLLKDGNGEDREIENIIDEENDRSRIIIVRR